MENFIKISSIQYFINCQFYLVDGQVIRYSRPFCDVTGLSRDFMQHYRYYIVFVQVRVHYDIFLIYFEMI